MNNSPSSPTSSRGRQRLYASASDKVGAFRERHKDAGYLRKEVLVREETSARLHEIAKQENVSVTNTASALLELGIAQYKSVRSLSATSTPFGAISGACASPVASENGSGTVVGAVALNALQAHPGHLRALSSAASNVASQESSALLVASTSSEVDAELLAVNPITSFFQKRKQNVK